MIAVACSSVSSRNCAAKYATITGITSPGVPSSSIFNSFPFLISLVYARASRRATRSPVLFASRGIDYKAAKIKVGAYEGCPSGLREYLGESLERSLARVKPGPLATPKSRVRLIYLLLDGKIPER